MSYECRNCGKQDWKREVVQRYSRATIMHVCRNCGRRVRQLSKGG